MGAEIMLQSPAIPVSGFRSGIAMARTAVVCGALALLSSRAAAHGISETSRETMKAGGILDYIWLGAEHMVTGYDHLLFLFGVIFFLTGFRDVVRFITAFTLGHCITLLGATLAGITANAYLIDAVIALSVVYKGFENLDGFQKTLGFRAPNLLAMVFIFGLVHGFGLSTRLQELTLGNEGLVSRILAFNVGVELGQVAALTVMLGIFAACRSSKTFERFGKVANVGLVLAGIGLFGFQVTGYLAGDDHHAHPAAEEATDPGYDHSTAGADHHTPAIKPPVQATVPSPVQPPAEHTPETDATPTDHGHEHGQATSKSRTKKHKPEHRHGSGKKHSH
jgi:hypothetical protein